MSKMSKLAMELDEQAAELGFEGSEEALAKGYEWIIDTQGNAVLYKASEEQEKAHEAWLEEREQVLDKIDEVINYLKEECDDETCERPTFMIGNLREVAKFIKRGEM